MRLAALCLLCLAGLAACARPPALDGSVTEADRRAPYPRLVPLDAILAAAPAPRAAPEDAGRLADRAGALRDRARRLRGPVVPAATEARMARGVDTGALR